MYNLGVYLRTAGMYAEALEQLKKTYLEARKRGNHDLAYLARSSAAWEALRLERIAEAEELVSQGEAYKPTDQRLQVSHQLDQAQLALLKGKIHAAGSLAFQAALQCEGSPDFLARAMEIILKAADREGEGELALIAGIVGKLQAEIDDRHDIMSQIAAQVQVLALRYPEAVERLMATIDDPK